MPFTLNAEVGAALHGLMGGQPPPQIPAGDVNSRRQLLDGMFAMVAAATPEAQDVEMKDFHTNSDDGHSILCRWYTKKDTPAPGSAIVYAHGGGYIGVSVGQYDRTVQRYVQRTGVPFLSVEYRLAPEVQAPTPVTDVYAGLKWLVAHAAELGVDPGRIGIMGDSAGGGITASLAHYIKLKGGPAVKKQILVYPMLDDRNLENDPEIAPFATWSTDDNKTGWGAVLGDRLGTEKVTPVDAAGRMTVADAKGLPPAYIDVGELDLFRDEDLDYARTLGKAGVETEFHLTPGAPHGYEAFAPESEIGRATFENRFRAIKSV